MCKSISESVRYNSAGRIVANPNERNEKKGLILIITRMNTIMRHMQLEYVAI